MSTRHGWIIGAALVALTTMTVGCAHSPRGVRAESAGDVAPARRTATLVVQNHNFADVDIYVVRDGDVSTRLGTVTGESTERFAIDPSLFPTGTLRLIGTPIGGSGAARSGPLLVNPGQTITFTVEPDLAASAATVQ